VGISTLLNYEGFFSIFFFFLGGNIRSHVFFCFSTGEPHIFQYALITSSKKIPATPKKFPPKGVSFFIFYFTTSPQKPSPKPFSLIFYFSTSPQKPSPKPFSRSRSLSLSLSQWSTRNRQKITVNVLISRVSPP